MCTFIARPCQAPQSAAADPRVAVRRAMNIEEKIKLGQKALDFQQARAEINKAWRVTFIRQKWGQHLEYQELQRLKSLVRRCETLARKRDVIREEFAIGRGRGQQGFRTHRTLFQAAKK